MSNPTAYLVGIDHKMLLEPITGFDLDGHVDYPETITRDGKVYRFIVRTMVEFFYFEDASGLRESLDTLEWEVKDLRKRLTQTCI